VPVVEAEREPEQVRVERAAHVEFDAERLPARDEAASGHEERARDADEDDRGDDELQCVLVVLLDGVA
jgi:hypothetical protein